MSDHPVRTRFAPSPTGFLHIGGLRTALYNYLFARQNGGRFVLRIEDTDQTRLVSGAEEALFEALDWAGLKPDESTRDGGSFAPYRQSDRLDIYRQHIDRLLEKGHAYRCFCSPERLEEMRAKQRQKKLPPMYDRACLRLSDGEIRERLERGEKSVVRLKVPRGENLEFVDTVRGLIRVSTDTVDDQVLLKSDGFPTYHLASVVDDHLMKITHVIRGEEWLPSTPKHVLLYRAFGWEVPQFAHLPLLLNPDRGKLSKRQGDVAVEDYRRKGYLPEALLNFTALLGWNPGRGETQEIFTLEELQKRFSLENVNKAGAVCDLKRLRWFNAQHIKRLSVEELLERARPFLAEKEFFRRADDFYKREDYLRRLFTVWQERLEVLSEVGKEDTGFFFARPKVSAEKLPWKNCGVEETVKQLERAVSVIQDIADEDWTRENLENVLMEAAGEKRGDFLWPLRMALTGADRSPGPMDCAWILGREETIERIKEAVNVLRRS